MTDEELAERNRLLEHEKLLREALAAEREKSHQLYAQKLVERIVFGGIAFVALAVLGAVVALVIQQ